jgi:hypothetical protein
MPVRRTRATPTHLVDGNEQVIEVGGHCGLFIDVAPDATAPAPGDWIATQAGSRYLVDQVRVVRRRRHAQQKRYQMTVLRLPKHTEPPADVHVIWLSWYPRGAQR